ncbi:hypothetical protein OKC48_16180 [Methylorubrum extorquens]|uniref:hypothetical protein n=1 Tax=Methylorubrum extorquens TaxID=408 RepID=UPI002238A7ED|nr:hypothetical protein [Methylorubrum extorquens]UYW24811.1 hypothetical protein OKC48_16180 [Methylorubrum extorquens]
MTALLTKDQLRALVPVAPQFSLRVTLFGQEVPAAGVKLGTYETHVFGRFESA